MRLDPGSTKNDGGPVFPFTIEMRALLEEQKASVDALRKDKGVICPWVFHRNGREIRSLRKAFTSARNKAGLPSRIPYDFRRKTVRNLVRAGIPERVAMQMTGHKTRSIFDRYNIISEGDLTDAARRMDLAAGIITGTSAQNRSSRQEYSNLQPV